MRPRWTPGQWALRSVVVVGVMVGVLSTGLVGEWPPWWFVVLVAVCAVLFAATPEGAVGTAAIGLVLAWWGIALRDGLHPQALVAAAGLLAAHLAALVASYGPGRMAVDPATVLLWVRRGLLVFLLAPLTWALAEAVQGRPEPPGLWTLGLVAAVATAFGISAVTARGQDA